MLGKIGPLVRDANELMAQMKVLNERFNKVMNHQKSCKRFVDHVDNSFCRTIYMVDHYRGELMSQEIDWCDEVSRETIYNLNAALSDVNAVNDALEVNAEVLSSLCTKLLVFSSPDTARD